MKAVLVIDAPKDCMSCELSHINPSSSSDWLDYCAVGGALSYTGKPDNCPLKIYDDYNFRFEDAYELYVEVTKKELEIYELMLQEGEKPEHYEMLGRHISDITTRQYEEYVDRGLAFMSNGIVSQQDKISESTI